MKIVLILKKVDCHWLEIVRKNWKIKFLFFGTGFRGVNGKPLYYSWCRFRKLTEPKLNLWSEVNGYPKSFGRKRENHIFCKGIQYENIYQQ